MFDNDDAAEYLQRAEMHEQLAAATSDLPARKMHQAMAAEYRRKASETGQGMIEVASIPKNDPSMLMMDAAP